MVVEEKVSEGSLEETAAKVSEERASTKTVADQDALKAAVGRQAVEYIDRLLTKDAVVGVGTGSTTNYFIDALAGVKHKFNGAVSSSEASTQRLLEHGIPVFELNDVNELIVYVDGADEANDRLQLIKGGGGAHTREKIIASCAKEFICILDQSKLVSCLGSFPLPVEVLPMARSAVARKIVALGGKPIYRQGFVTDNNNHILDIHKMQIDEPVSLERELNNIVGVVANGLFSISPPQLLLVATPTGVEVRRA